MVKMGQKQIRDMIKSGAFYKLEEFEYLDYMAHEGGYETVAYSTGINGANGVVIQGQTTGRLYALACRSSLLFKYL